MIRRLPLALGFLLAGSPAFAGDVETVAKIAAFVDARMDAAWLAQGTKPAPIAEDGEFVRRLYLDLIGRIPKVSEARAFADDPSPNKRAALAATLMGKPGFNAHLAAAFRTAWLPGTLTDIQKNYLGDQYENWLRKELAKGTGFDAIVRRTLTVPVFAGQRGIQRQQPNGRNYDEEQAGLEAFYTAVDVKPENLGASASRSFLGLKLECAQCHDHPFAPHTRDQFWKFSAFFAEFTPLPPYAPSFVGPLPPQSDKNLLTMPGASRMVRAEYLDGGEPEWRNDRTPREELADWLLAPENQYFSRNLANRLWAHLFGIGLIDPLEEPGEKNPPSHPELLEGLAKLLQEAKYDPRLFLRGLAASRAYQLTSTLTHPSQSEPRRFARMSLKALTPSQIYDSFVVATGIRNPQSRRNYYPREQSGRGAIAALFPVPQNPARTDSSILQALMMMNGKLVADQTELGKGQTLGAIADAPFLDSAGKVEALFLATFARQPTPAESEKFASYVERGGPANDKAKALADAFWVLLNSPEFLFNH